MAPDRGAHTVGGMSRSEPFQAIIVGGGPAALEAALRLQRVSDGRVATTILAPEEDFVTRPMSVLVPFATAHAPSVPLARMAAEAGATLHTGSLASVDAEAQEVVTHGGERLRYDALLIAVGARYGAPSPHVLPFGMPGSEERMHGLVQDLESGYVHSVAFVVPSGSTWPLALYELALMLADRAYETGQSPRLVLVTPEDAPLALFGPEASRAVAARLQDARIDVRAGAHADVVRRGTVELHPGRQLLEVDRIVSLPRADGPAITGLPHDADGFLTVDRHGRVEGTEAVYAAGDATSFPVKQGGLACRQADAAADAIAVQAGVGIEPEPFTAVLEGVLLTERAATFLRRDASGAAGDDSVVSDHALWWPPAKIAGRELARHLGPVTRHLAPLEEAGVEVRRPVDVA
jgi:sulfide:quinone oxidoreductase